MLTVLMSKLAWGWVLALSLVRLSGVPFCSSVTGWLGKSYDPATGTGKSAYALRFVSRLTGPSNETEHGASGQRVSIFVICHPGAVPCGVRTSTASLTTARWSMFSTMGVV